MIENEIIRTDFEKLLFAEAYISELKKEVKSLKIEMGKLKSEIDEYKYIPELTREQKVEINKQAKLEVRKDQLFVNMEISLEKSRGVIDKLKTSLNKVLQIA